MWNRKRTPLPPLSVLGLLLLAATAVYAQPPTQHGILLTWTAPSPIGGSGTLASYNIYRCLGTCTPTSGAFTMLTGQIASVTTYLDPAAGLVSGNTYTYAVTSVDSAGSESVYSPLAVVAFALIANPNAPTGLTATSK